MTDKLKMYSIKEVADLFGTTRQTIEMLRREGVLPAIKIGKKYMFTMKSIEQFQNDYQNMNMSNPKEIRKSIDIKNNRNN
ncbi:MAG: helix-turn-helix domain-containing protein [Clostridiales bacterium]|nr:helix-turn-helix domain-containing protein [Clostridiales bacterium]